MPHIVRPLENQDVIEHNIALSIVDHLAQLLEFSIDNIVTVSAHNEIENRDANIDNMRGKESKEYNVTVSYKSEIRDENVSEFRVNKNYNVPILVDKSNLYMLPINVPSVMTIHFKVESDSSTYINNLLNRIRLTTKEHTDSAFHDLLYRYYIPHYIGELLYTIYKYREELLGDVKSYQEYIELIKVKDIELVSDISGKRLDLAIIDRQEQTLGRFISSGFDLKSEFDRERNRYSLEFDYILYYEKPTYFRLDYQISMYNQILPSKFITLSKKMTGYSSAKRDLLEGQQSSFDFTIGCESKIQEYIWDRYIHIPKEDIYPEYRDMIGFPLFSVLVLVEEDTQKLFNLEEISDEFTIEPSILKFIKSGEYEYIGREFHSFIELTLYENDRKIRNGLKITEELDVYSVKRLDPQNRYRVVMSINLNVRELLGSGYRRVMRHLEELRDRHYIGYRFIENREVPKYFKPLISNSEWNRDFHRSVDRLNSIDRILDLVIKRDFTSVNRSVWEIDIDNRPDWIDMDIVNKSLNRIKATIEEVEKIIYVCGNYIFYMRDGIKHYITVNGRELLYILSYYEDRIEINLLNGYLLLIKDGEIFVYNNSELIARGRNLYEILYNIFELILGVSLFVDEYRDFPIMKTVEYSSVIAYSMRV